MFCSGTGLPNPRDDPLVIIRRKGRVLRRCRLPPDFVVVFHRGGLRRRCGRTYGLGMRPSDETTIVFVKPCPHLFEFARFLMPLELDTPSGRYPMVTILTGVFHQRTNRSPPTTCIPIIMHHRF